MRILTVGNRYPPWSLGGYEVVWSAAVRWLREAGHEVRVLTTRPDPADLSASAPPPPEVHRDLEWYWRNHQFPRRSLAAVARLERTNAGVFSGHVREFAPDVVCWWAMGGMSLSLLELARRARLPAVGSVGDEWMSYGPRVDTWMRVWRGRWRPLRGVAERIWGLPARLDLGSAARWLFTSRFLLTGARAAGWALPDADVLAHGVDQRLFAFQSPGRWRWRLLYCGRVDPRKGIDTAIEALARLPAHATLTIHGTGQDSYGRQLRELADRLGVSERVRFHHSTHDTVPAAYRDCDAVLFPVRWREPWGLVPLEAMSVGRPVLASRAGGGPDEYLREEANCLRFEVADAGALAAAVARLAGDDSLRARLVEAGLRTATRFSQEAFHCELERELVRAARGSSARSLAPQPPA